MLSGATDARRLGSFFCAFDETEDQLGVCEALLQTYAEAHDIYAGLLPDGNDSESDGEDDVRLLAVGATVDCRQGHSFDLGDESDEDKPKAKRPRKA